MSDKPVVVTPIRGGKEKLAQRGPDGRLLPGYSANPTGRTKHEASRVHEVRKLAGKYTKQAVLTLADLMANGKTEKVRLMAAQALLDRSIGKPLQNMKVDGDTAGRLLVVFQGDWKPGLGVSETHPEASRQLTPSVSDSPGGDHE